MISFAQVRRRLPWRGVLERCLVVCFLVFATYNPTNYSLSLWLISGTSAFSVRLMVACSLFVLWVVVLRVSFSGLRGYGVFMLACLALATGLLEWEFGFLSRRSPRALFFLSQLGVAAAISLGLVMSYWTRQFAGQSPVVKNPP